MLTKLKLVFKLQRHAGGVLAAEIWVRPPKGRCQSVPQTQALVGLTRFELENDYFSG